MTTGAPADVDDILTQLSRLSKSPLSILKLGETISIPAAEAAAAPPTARTSDASSSSQPEAATPGSLAADLAHYRELFAKLRFSYVEQVTKEKFIRAIVGDPPLIVSPHDNVALEKDNLAAKAALKSMKVEAAELVAELERRGRDLCSRYEGVKTQVVQLGELPEKIAGLEERIRELREQQELPENPNLGLPLGRTRELVEEKKAMRCEVDRELDQLRAKVPRKRKELERLENEVQGLEAKRTNSLAAAKEARRRRENALGGVEDDLEERGRWWRASEAVLTQALGIQC
jgi:archaellum component FlaC